MITRAFVEGIDFQITEFSDERNGFVLVLIRDFDRDGAAIERFCSSVSQGLVNGLHDSIAPC